MVWIIGVNLYLHTFKPNCFFLIIWLQFWFNYLSAAKTDLWSSTKDWFIAEQLLNYKSHIGACPGCLQVHRWPSCLFCCYLVLRSNLFIWDASSVMEALVTSHQPGLSVNHWNPALWLSEEGLPRPAIEAVPLLCFLSVSHVWYWFALAGKWVFRIAGLLLCC